MNLRRISLALVLGFSLCAHSIAYAQSEPSAADVDTARTAFQQALDLRDNKHDARAAVEKLKAAYALVPTPRIGLELGKTYRQLNQLVEAKAAFLDVDRLPQSVTVAGQRKPESAEARKARDDCRAAASDLDLHIPSLIVHVRGSGQVTIDGEPVRADALTVPRRMNPGKHVVALLVDGVAQSRKIVDLRDSGDTATLELEAKGTDDTEVAQLPHDTTTYVPPNPQLSTVPNPARSALLTTAYLGAGLGLASDLISFLVTSKAQTDKCDSITKVCSSLSGKTTAMAFAIAGDVLLGVGVVAFIVALTLPKTVAPSVPDLGFSPTQGGGYISAGGHF